MTLPWVFRELGQGIFDPNGRLGVTPLPATGGGIPDVVIAPFDCNFTDTADLFMTGVNDEIIIQEAIAMLVELGGGWIHILSGTVNIGAETSIPYGIKVTGAGMDVTTFVVSSGATMNSVFDVATFKRVDFLDLTISGNKPGGTINSGLITAQFPNFQEVALTRVKLINSTGNGYGSPARTGGLLWLEDCIIKDNDANGVSNHESTSYANGCHIVDNAGSGWVNSYGGDQFINGCKISGNGGHGILEGDLFGGGSHTWIIVGSDISSNGGDGVNADHFTSGPMLCVGNVIQNNGGVGVRAFPGSIIGPNLYGGNLGGDVVGGEEPALVSDIPTTSPQVVTFNLAGTLGGLVTGALKFVVPRTGTITGIRIAVGTVPTGSDLIVDVNKNSGTIYTTQANRPRIVASGSAVGAETVPDVTALVGGDYLTVDIDQIGSTVPGSDLTVLIDISWDLTPGA